MQHEVHSYDQKQAGEIVFGLPLTNEKSRCGSTTPPQRSPGAKALVSHASGIVAEATGLCFVESPRERETTPK
jgi:hypothetical protein